MIIDDGSGEALTSKIGTLWQVADDASVFAGGTDMLRSEMILGRSCVRLTGNMDLCETGGVLQMRLDLRPGGGLLDVGDYEGVRFSVWGNNKIYAMRLKTPDTPEPWQCYRAYFDTDKTWHETLLPFDEFEGHGTSEPLDVNRLSALALVATGRGFKADLAVCEMSFYR